MKFCPHLKGLEKGEECLPDFNFFVALPLIVCNLFSFNNTRSKSKGCYRVKCKSPVEFLLSEVRQYSVWDYVMGLQSKDAAGKK